MQTKRAKQRQGFTLLELMIVVVITGVLAAIAIPTFTGYVYKSRTSEATQFLGQIKLRQEEYRSEFGAYAQIPDGATELADFEYAPGDQDTMKGSVSKPFPGGVYDLAWAQLGADPGGPVRFGYGVIAGTPADGALGGPWNFPADHYFVAQAVSDLDGDKRSITFEITSHTNGVWFSKNKGWE